MKSTIESTIVSELEPADLAASLIHWARQSKTNSQEMTRMIMSYLTESIGYTRVLEVQKNEDLSKIVVKAEIKQDDGAKLLGTVKPVKEVVEKKSNEGFTRKNVGFYSMVHEIVQQYKKKNKNFISFDEIRSILINEYDKKEKDVEPWRVKQYLAKSQIERNAKVLFRGIKRSKDNEGLAF